MSLKNPGPLDSDKIVKQGELERLLDAVRNEGRDFQPLAHEAMHFEMPFSRPIPQSALDDLRRDFEKGR